jgi:hypothetical protein
MKKEIVIYVIFVLLIIIRLSGCTDDLTDMDKIIGNWKYESFEDSNLSIIKIITFYENGTIYSYISQKKESGFESYYENTTYWSVYELRQGNMCHTPSDTEYCFDYAFENDDNTLTLSYFEKSIEYTKQ